MHVYHLAITSLATHNGRNHDELVLEDEVAYTSLVLAANRGQVELQGGGELDKAQEENREE